MMLSLVLMYLMMFIVKEFIVLIYIDDSQLKIMNDLYEVYERFCIMTEQKDVTEDEALKYIAKHTNKDLFKQLYTKVKASRM